ncbi:MAG TPA: TlpA disulfide reductase family protein [Devosia sp.]
MTDQAPKPARLQPRRVLVLALLSAAVALAITLWVGNNSSQAAACPANTVEAAKLDAAALGELAGVNGTGQGRSYADMALKDAAGQPLTVESFAGKRLLINFWASWCIPCREEMPALNALAQKYNSDTFMVLPVNTGETDPAKGAKFLADGNWPNLPLYAEANSFEVINRLKTTAVSAGLPASVLVDEKGCELAVLQGPAEWDSPDGHGLIEAFLGLRS